MANVYNKPIIVVGGGGAKLPVDNGAIYEGKYRVRYFDIDGTVLKIEYVAEGGTLNPPSNPNYDPDYLIFDDWGYDIENYIVDRPVDVGATYKTIDDATYMFCRFTKVTELNPTILISGFTHIDWGDGTIDTNNSHTYTKEGNYVIKIYGNISVNIAPSSYLFGDRKKSSALQKCYLKKGITSLEYTFKYCQSLTIISIPNSITSIGKSTFNACHSLTIISIPNSVTSIGESTFYNCYSLTNVLIPNSVTSIKDSTFSGCYSLTIASIPNSITSIEIYAFGSVYKQENYIMNFDIIPTLQQANAFSGISYSAIMWIKDSIIEQLKIAKNWSNYADIMKPLSWYPSLTNPNE